MSSSRCLLLRRLLRPHPSPPLHSRHQYQYQPVLPASGPSSWAAPSGRMILPCKPSSRPPLWQETAPATSTYAGPHTPSTSEAGRFRARRPTRRRRGRYAARAARLLRLRRQRRHRLHPSRRPRRHRLRHQHQRRRRHQLRRRHLRSLSSIQWTRQRMTRRRSLCQSLLPSQHPLQRRMLVTLLLSLALRQPVRSAA